MTRLLAEQLDGVIGRAGRRRTPAASLLAAAR
jgi:hypothetical protein